MFELVLPQGAEVIGTYQEDFYAGSPAVARNSFGAGHGWYVAAGLDQAGVGWVVRQVLDTHGIAGRHPGLPELESAARVAPDGTRLLFLLNHAAESVEAPAGADGVDLLTGERVTAGRPVRLEAYGVRVLREDG